MTTSSASSRTALTLFAVGVFMAGLDNGIVSSSLTTLINSFHVTASWGAWIITVYTLGLAVSVPIMAKLSDRHGRKRMFLVAVALFGLGSLSVALSHAFWMLLVSRVVESLGAGGIFPIASGYIVATVPLKRQGRALGMIGGMNGLSAVIGPNVGAFILGLTGSWHWLFWINVPIALALFASGSLRLQESRSSARDRLDFAGIVLLSLGILGLLYGLTNLSAANVLHSVHSPSVYGFGLGGLVIITAFLFYENRLDHQGRDPLIPITLLRRPDLRWALLGGLASGLILSAAIFMPAFLQAVLGWPATQAGYWFTPLAILSGVGAIGGGFLVDHRGPIATLIFGFVAAAVGSLLFPLWVQSTGEMVVASAILGLGIGITMGAPLKLLITERVRDNKTTALGFLSLMREIGLTIGPIVFAGFLTRSMIRFPQQVAARFHAAGIPWTSATAGALTSASAHATLGNLLTDLKAMPPGRVRNLVRQAAHQVMSTAFHHMFWASGVISALGIATVLITARHRRHLALPATDPS